MYGPSKENRKIEDQFTNTLNDDMNKKNDDVHDGILMGCNKCCT